MGRSKWPTIRWKAVTIPSHRAGLVAEQRAALFLEKKGVQLLERNFRCRWGEIDIIGQSHLTLIFVEVKFRSRARWGTPLAQVTNQKKIRLVRTAMTYLQQRQTDHFDQIRFDVLACAEKTHWIQGAFSADDLILD